MEVKFNKPYIAGNELEYIHDAMHRKTSGDGYYTKQVTKLIEDTFHVHKAFLTTSCTSALEMACLLLGIKDGDEVIMPSFTFPSTANAVLLRGGKCVFADIDHTFNLDLNDVKRKITSKTKAVIVVHYASASCDMDELMALASKYDFYVIEDAAQAVNATYKDKYLGTIGDIGCFSFHETKNYSCGEGGALLINKKQHHLIKQAEIIREKGTNRADFNRGNAEFYTWVSIGSSYLPSELLSAHLLAQLEQIEEINQLRKERFEYYKQKLKKFSDDGMLKIPHITRHNHINYHMFYVILNSKNERNELMKFLQENQVDAYFHYVPLHQSPQNRKLNSHIETLKMTEDIVDRQLRLPLYPSLSLKEIDYVVSLMEDYLNNRNKK